jgi:hypothetical protein
VSPTPIVSALGTKPAFVIETLNVAVRAGATTTRVRSSAVRRTGHRITVDSCLWKRPLSHAACSF